MSNLLDPTRRETIKRTLPKQMTTPRLSTGCSRDSEIGMLQTERKTKLKLSRMKMSKNWPKANCLNNNSWQQRPKKKLLSSENVRRNCSNKSSSRRTATSKSNWKMKKKPRKSKKNLKKNKLNLSKSSRSKKSERRKRLPNRRNTSNGQGK